MSKSSHRQSPSNKTINSPVSGDDSSSQKTRRRPSGKRGQQRRDLILDTAANLLAEASVRG
ncbi:MULTISPECIES: hypothetical protein [Nostoc]|uniref:TetR family transcriptional regulator n=1 Tax=Nostoc paludosum FACHB-159 TaxID=2692908 RepID=A0ABR8KK93_9NOSO|nr:MULTISPECIES: hypothetical protein [Nostoc]MBD2683631.1 hypothetical protein [Nostoc sp. FACHB-857]MBD2739956.1 hypothetical protein [Nostoc paludosum FACHB-159]